MTHKKEMMTGMVALVCYSDIEHYKDGWIWYPFIPRKGITLLLGAPGIGKSMFLMQIIAVLRIRSDVYRKKYVHKCKEIP